MTVTLTATLTSVAMTTRELAGALVRDERARQGLTNQTKAAQKWGISRATLIRIEEGKEQVVPSMYRVIEGALGLPTNFLSYVIADDRTRIARMPALREDLRWITLDQLEEMATPHNRRATDHG